jgi:hypothetical protein
MSPYVESTESGSASCNGFSDQYYGKYRGTVINHIDPLRLGRIQVVVPDVTGLIPGTWALPCFPVTGVGSGFFAVPLPGSLVWVEFEQGDADKPIWVGGFYGLPVELPALSNLTTPPLPSITIQTSFKTGMTISEMPGSGGIVLQSGLASITVNETGIFIKNGAGAIITMVGNIVDINTNALTIV